MTTSTTCRRSQRRHTAAGTNTAAIEFSYPQPEGRRYLFPLVDLSVSGVSFVFENELSGIEGGTALSDVRIHLGDCEILGDLVVMHVTENSATQWTCGALFYAASDTDLLKWRSAIAGIEAVR
jgi:hypothetical protein